MTPSLLSDPRSHLPLTDLTYQILLSLVDEPRHGYAILTAISARSGGELEPETGTLYTALRRLRRDGLLAPTDAPTGGRRGRTYALTPLGRDVVRLESRRLADLVAVADSLRLLGDGAERA